MSFRMIYWLHVRKDKPREIIGSRIVLKGSIEAKQLKW